MDFFRSMFKRRGNPAAVRLGRHRTTLAGIDVVFAVGRGRRVEYADALRDLDDFGAGPCGDTAEAEAFLDTVTGFAPVELRPGGSLPGS